MRSVRRIFLRFLAGFALLLAAFIVWGVSSGKISLPVRKKPRFVLPDTCAVYASPLRVSGNGLIDDTGEAVVLRGVMTPEMKKLNEEKKFNQAYFDQVFALGGNVLRVPVHPYAWEQDEYYLWRYLDPVVTWAVEKGVYVILDMHCIGSIRTGKGEEMPVSDAEAFARSFWQSVADYFRDVPNVLFEIYNEPAQIDAGTWSDYAAQLVDVIRQTGAEQVIIVSGTDYAYDLNFWREHPLADGNVMYSAHVFPNRQGLSTLSANAERLPVIVTEWGYIAKGEPIRQRYLSGTRETYGLPMLELMAEKKISWVACWYDDGWEPPMLQKNGSGFTDWGALARDALAAP